LSVRYGQQYRVHLAVSPLLAVVDGEAREREADRLLAARSRQVFELLQEIIRLTARVGEVELRTEAHPGSLAPPLRRMQPRPSPAEPQLLFEGQIHPLSDGTTDRLISVLLPVKNGAAQLGELLPRILSQRSRANVEVIAVD